MKFLVQVYLRALLVAGIFIVPPATFSVAADAITAAKVTGANSRIAKREYQRLTSREQLAELWRRHRGPGNVAVPAGLRRVDFRKSIVIAIFEGRAMNGSRIRVESISEERERIVFRYRIQGYQTAGLNGGGVPSTVYGFFVVPRSAKALALEEDVEGHQLPPHGRPAVWTKRHIFPQIPDLPATG